MVDIHQTRRGLADGFLRTSPGEERPVEDGQLHLPGVIGNGDGEDAGILVVHVDEIDAAIRVKRGKSHALPVKQVLRYRQGDPWADRGKRRIRHDIALEPLHKRDARILTTATAVSPVLVVGLRLERDPEPLDAGRVAGLVESNPGNPDTRIIALRDESGKQVKLTIRTANDRGIENTLGLHRIAGLRLHHDAHALQLKAAHRRFPGRASGEGSLSRQAIIASITRLDSSGSLTWIDNAPASLAG